MAARRPASKSRKSSSTTSSKASKSSKSSKSAKGKSSGGRRRAAKRELINTGRDKRFVRRGKGGQFKESDDVSRSLRADRRTKAKTKAKRGQGDRGDR